MSKTKNKKLICRLAVLGYQKDGVIVEEVERGLVWCKKASLAPSGPQTEVRFWADKKRSHQKLIFTSV